MLALDNAHLIKHAFELHATDHRSHPGHVNDDGLCSFRRVRCGAEEAPSEKPHAVSLRNHSHESEHVIVDKMGTYTTHHEKGTGLRKIHHLITVLWEESRIQSSVDSVIRIVDQPRWV